MYQFVNVFTEIHLFQTDVLTPSTQTVCLAPISSYPTPLIYCHTTILLKPLSVLFSLAFKTIHTDSHTDARICEWTQCVTDSFFPWCTYTCIVVWWDTWTRKSRKGACVAVPPSHKHTSLQNSPKTWNVNRYVCTQALNQPACLLYFAEPWLFCLSNTRGAAALQKTTTPKCATAAAHWTAAGQKKGNWQSINADKRTPS